MTRGKT